MIALAGSLRGRLIVLTLAILVPFVVVLFVQAAAARARARDDAQAETLRTAYLVAERTASGVSESMALLTGFGGRSSEAADPRRCEGVLGELDDALLAVTSAVFIDASGRVACSSDAVTPDADVAERAYVLEALEEGGFAVGLEPPGPFGADTLLVVVRPTPAPAGALLGVTLDVGRGLPPLEEFDLPAGSTMQLVDFEGRVIASSPDIPAGALAPPSVAQQMIDVASTGNSVAPGSDGVRRAYGFAAVAGTDEYVYGLVGIPTSFAFTEANNELRSNLIALGIIGLLALLLALALAEVGVTRPIRAMHAAVRRLGAGDLDARTSVKGHGELGQLARAVDVMADGIQTRDDSLRQATEDRERLLGELLEAQEEERRRIAADIHDDTIQSMIAVGLQTQLLRRRLHDPEAVEGARALEQGVNHAVRRLRQLMFELEPATAEEGLEVSLEQYLASVLADINADIEIEVSAPDVAEPTGAARQVLYRNLREAALNAARHGRPDCVAVDVAYEEGGLLVAIRDDGEGMQPAEARKPGHHGLRTMRERSEQLGGWLQLESAPGEGTTVRFWLP